MGTVVRAVARACARSSAAMKLNIAYPTNGTQKKVEVNEDQKLLPFFDKRISAEVPGDSLGDEFKGYIFKIMGGQDKRGFPMKQGVLTSGRVRVLMEHGQTCFLGYGRRNGECRRKTVRGCIVSQDLSTLNLKVVKVGDAAIPGLTDTSKPKMRGPKRASKIRKLFALNKGDDARVRQHLPPRLRDEERQQAEQGAQDPAPGDAAHAAAQARAQGDQGGQDRQVQGRGPGLRQAAADAPQGEEGAALGVDCEEARDAGLAGVAVIW